MTDCKTLDKPFTLIQWLEKNKLNKKATIGYTIKKRYTHTPKRYIQYTIDDYF